MAFTTYTQAIKSMIWSDAEVAFKDHFPCTMYKVFEVGTVFMWFIFIRPFVKRYKLWEHLRQAGRQAGRRRPQGFRSLSKIVFIPSVSNLVNMFVGIISQPRSITCQIPPGTPELWPLNCPKSGFLLSKSKSFYPVFIKISKYIGVHNISTKFYNLPNPPDPELWPLNCPKTELAVSVLQIEYPAPKNVVITNEFTTNTTGVFSQFGTLVHHMLYSDSYFIIQVIRYFAFKLKLATACL